MLKPSHQPIIFTDLDGTLLDHYSYSFEAAIPMLGKLEDLGIPVIPITSKTFAEVSRLRDQLNNRHPFIVENGAAIAIPKNYFDARLDNWVDQGDLLSNGAVCLQFLDTAPAGRLGDANPVGELPYRQGGVALHVG